jgi:hypothetical protein
VKRVAVSLAIALISAPAFAADRIEGRVKGGGRLVAKADVTLWVAGPGAPQKLAETQTKNDGNFDLTFGGEKNDIEVLSLGCRETEKKGIRGNNSIFFVG